MKFLFRRGAEEEAGGSVPPAENDTGSAPAEAAPSQTWRHPETSTRPDSFPRFKGVSSAVRADRQEPEHITRARNKLRDAFTPAQPVTDRRLFAGRLEVLSHLIEVIENRLAHVVVFGERGIGKTSLLHILSDLARESDYLTVRATCGSGSDFAVLFRTLLRNIPILFHASTSPTEMGSESGSTLADLLPDRPFDARELSDLLAGVTSCRVLIVLDEYDRVQSEAFRINIAELIKNLSDAAAPVQLVIAGVSSNLHELIGYIPSIRRNVVGLPLPKLVQSEVGEIIARGERASGIRFDPDLVALIHDLSQGSPYLVRLVCYHSSINALEHERMTVILSDIREGLDQMVEESAARLSIPALQRVSKLDWLRHGLLLAEIVHLAATPNGWFSAVDVAERAPDQSEAVQQYIRDELIPAHIVEAEGTAPETRYRFVDEGLQSFLWMTMARLRLQSDSA